MTSERVSVGSYHLPPRPGRSLIRHEVSPLGACRAARSSPVGNPAGHNLSFESVLVIVGAIALMLLGIVAYMRFFRVSTDRAQDAWDQAMQTMVDRLGITFYPSSASYDWSGAAGTFRDMVTDPDRLLAAVATALDLAIILEAADG